jgi:hypothetical protein
MIRIKKYNNKTYNNKNKTYYNKKYYNILYMSDIVIWILFIFVLLIIIGLYISESTPLNLDEKKKILDLKYTAEYFNNKSSSNEVEGGASEYYKWGLPEDKIEVKDDEKDISLSWLFNDKNCHKKCDTTCPPLNCPKKCPEIKQDSKCDDSKASNSDCKNCDITRNKDIDKYILKSSVPPCPNMNNYVSKNMLPPNVNMNDYMLKSDVKPCEKVDISKYILKSEIPGCPTCPICPECPICPPQNKCKNISEYTINEHPDYSKYISIDKVKEKYILKTDCDKKVQEAKKNYINQEYKKHENNKNQEYNYYEYKKHESNKKEDNSKNKNATEYKKEMDKIYKKQDNKFPLEQPDGYYAGDSLFAKA